MKIPPQYLPVMPYLILGDARGFLDFAQQVFGATELMIARDEQNSIRHGEINIGPAVIMFAQSTDQWPIKPAGMFLYVENVYQVYDAAMHRNAISLMHPERKDYGYTAGFEDPAGNHWWIVQGE